MAWSSRTICKKPGCGVSTFGPYCSKHKDEKPDRAPDHRPNATQRGYDARWKKLRNRFIQANPICKHCEERGRVTPAQDVDHITPFNGMGDPLRLKWANLQSLCRACHNRKTRNETRAK